MSEPVILAVDQGTSATKAIAVGTDMRIIARSARPLAQRYPRPGWAEQDPEELWQSVVGALTDLLALSPGRAPAGATGSGPGDVPQAVWSLTGLALSTQRESVLAWDASTGRALTPMISWQDRRAGDWCRALAATPAGPMITERTGLPVDPMFSAGKLRWLLDHHDGLREAARRGTLRAGTVDAWLLWRLTGGTEHLCEIGNASRTQLLGLDTGRWDEDLLAAFGVPAGVLPSVRSSTGPFGVTRSVPGLPDRLPVLAVLGDSHAALLAQAGLRPGVVKATFGTGSSVMAVIPAEGRPPAGLARTIAWQHSAAPPAFAAEGNIASAGAAIRWVGRLLGHDDAELARLAATAPGEHADQDAAPGTPPGDSLVLVPAFGGLGAPYWDNDARAILVGMTHATGPAQLARAAFESVVFQVTDTFVLVDEAVGGAAELRADGGASVNDRLMQLQADLIGRPVRRAASPEASALGAAYLAGLATGQWTGADLASAAGTGTVFRPRASEQWRARTLSRWRDALTRSRLAQGTGPEPRPAGPG